MELWIIWILVIALLAIAVVLLIASFYTKDNFNVEEEFANLQTQQSKELFNIKTRIAELEQELTQSLVARAYADDAYEHYDDQQVVEEAIELSEISDLTKEEVIRLYSQGFTMHEIANDVALNIKTVQLIVDDYIENR